MVDRFEQSLINEIFISILMEHFMHDCKQISNNFKLFNFYSNFINNWESAGFSLLEMLFLTIKRSTKNGGNH